MVDSIVYAAAGEPIQVVLRNPWGNDGYVVIDGVDDGLVTVTGQQLVDSMPFLYGISPFKGPSRTCSLPNCRTQPESFSRGLPGS